MCDDIFDFNGNGESDLGDLYLEMKLVNGNDETDFQEKPIIPKITMMILMVTMKVMMMKTQIMAKQTLLPTL